MSRQQFMLNLRAVPSAGKENSTKRPETD